MRVINDVLSTRQQLPLCPRFQTYCCLPANDVQGHHRYFALQVKQKAFYDILAVTQALGVAQPSAVASPGGPVSGARTSSASSMT